jgi:hypothetical protein
MIVVAQLLNPAWRVEVEMDAVLPSTHVSTSGDLSVPIIP